MNFRQLIEGYNKKLGAMYVKAKEDIKQIHGNSDFILMFKYKGEDYEYTFGDSSTKGIEKEFKNIFNKNIIPFGVNPVEMTEVDNIKLSDISEFDYEIN